MTALKQNNGKTGVLGTVITDDAPKVKQAEKLVDYTGVKQAITDLLIAIGEDPDRPGLQETPHRVAKFWQEFMDYDPGKTDTVFAFDSSQQNNMVMVTGMRAWSLCEHHLLPFWCDVSISYLPREQVLGLSKFARIAHKFAHKLQIQEQLAAQIAAEVQHLTGSPHVAVKTEGQHLCMIMRGIKTVGTMTSIDLRGEYRENPVVREQFFNLVRGQSC